MKTDPVTRNARIAAAIGALILLAIPAGAAVAISRGGSSVPVMWAQLLVVPLFAYIVMRYPRPLRRVLPLAWWTIVPLSVGVIIAPVFTSAAVAFFNFATGVLTGMLLGCVWGASERRWSLIDWGLTGLTLITSIQIALSVRGAPHSVAHQFAATPWGRSNYAAGLLVVMVLIVLVRIHETRRHRWLYLAMCVASVSIYLSLSRGALVAATAGIVALLWQRSPHPSGRTGRAVRWLFLAAVPVVAYFLILRVTSTRAGVNSQVFRNIETRQELWALAWREFLNNPLTGQGWTSLRGASSELVERQSFAHNVLLSFLQQGGLLALPVLVLIAWGIWNLWRKGSLLVAPAAAIGMLSVTEPVFEAFVGGLLFWMMLLAHLTRSDAAREVSPEVQQVVSTPNPRVMSLA